MTAFGLQDIHLSFSSTSTNPNLPHHINLIILVCTVMECAVCALFVAALLRWRVVPNGSHSHHIAFYQMSWYTVPACFATMYWQLAFAVAIWYESESVAAYFAIPLGPASNVMLFSLLHANPWELASPTRTHAMSRGHSPRRASISITKDITIMSCHDSPLEIELMGRLERAYPEEEESRSYDVNLDF
ncbi:hypothetical protein DL93DRAFT_2087380 [Clavulina sp. PMI_390]|nr:hypothetical protein DL93DRAFT_2087380 [Clavulina sp. PMI_390]